MFQKDFFSNYKIRWKKTKNIDVENIVKNNLLKNKDEEKLQIYQHSGLEINSKNFKIKINRKFKLLKRWDMIYVNRISNWESQPGIINPKNVINTLQMLKWLISKRGSVLNVVILNSSKNSKTPEKSNTLAFFFVSNLQCNNNVNSM